MKKSSNVVFNNLLLNWVLWNKTRKEIIDFYTKTLRIKKRNKSKNKITYWYSVGHFVIATGFEPVTVCLEGRCSIQLSYATILYSCLTVNHNIYWQIKAIYYLSGWQDSNLRPPRPKRGAITGLRYTPKTVRTVNFNL